MKNIAESVRTRLLNLSRSQGMPFDDLLQRYVTGSILHRLNQSKYRDHFVLKGAQLFTLWAPELYRPTRDLDLLGYGEVTEETIQEIFQELIALPMTPEDGITWSEVLVSPIRIETDYGGVRARLLGELAKARIDLQIDIGVGDAITPPAQEQEWSPLLDFPSFLLMTYPPETVIAEKLETSVIKGLQNSRMKDFFDLHWLQAHQSFDMKTLREAIVATFERRKTELPKSLPLALTEDFSRDTTKEIQWKAFLRKNKLEEQPLREVISQLRFFLEPVLFPPADLSQLTWNPDTDWS